MTLEELQDKLYDVLCLVDGICKKENVRYFLDGGTEIGSVREKNIIPWDDDIDVKVLREDYDKFKEAMIKNLPENYKFIEPEEYSPYFYDFVPRIIDVTQKMRAETDEDTAYKNYQNFVGIDVFIFENAPDGALAQKLMTLKCKTLYGMAMSKRYKVHNDGYSFAQKLTSGVCMTLGKLYSHEKIFKKWNKAMRKYEGRKTNTLFPANYLLRDLGFFKREWYENTAEGELRGRKFPIPAGYDPEMTKIYGDYMKPPKDRSIYVSHI